MTLGLVCSPRFGQEATHNNNVPKKREPLLCGGENESSTKLDNTSTSTDQLETQTYIWDGSHFAFSNFVSKEPTYIPT